MKRGNLVFISNKVSAFKCDFSKSKHKFTQDSSPNLSAQILTDAPLQYDGPVCRVLEDPVVAVPVRHEEVAIGQDSHGTWLAEVLIVIAGYKSMNDELGNS